MVFIKIVWRPVLPVEVFVFINGPFPFARALRDSNLPQSAGDFLRTFFYGKYKNMVVMDMKIRYGRNVKRWPC